MHDDKRIYIDIMLSFHCKKECPYCYLGHLRNNEQKVSPREIDARLAELWEHGYHAGNIEIYGGDMALLPKEYIDEVIQICRKYTDFVTAIGNPWKIYDPQHYKNVVSINKERKDYFNNITELCENSHLDVITVALPDEMDEDPVYFLDRYQGSTGSLFIIPYFQSVYNTECPHTLTNKEYCEFLIRVIDAYIDREYTFNLANIGILEDARNGQYNPFADGSIYIGPDGRLGRPKYTEDLKEYFEWYDSIAEWEEDTLKERREAIETCGTCEYYGKCIADHMRPFAKDDVCCGYKRLVEWCEENRERFSVKGQREM